MASGEMSVKEYVAELRKVAAPRLDTKISMENRMIALTEDEKHKRDEDARITKKAKDMTDDELRRALELRQPFAQDAEALANAVAEEFDDF